jgi:HD-GYP domain-containing protein (c-di-GMP phosphodiesterase class II)
MIEYDLIELDHLADIGVTEMTGLIRLHTQEVTRLTTLIGLKLSITLEQIAEFEQDCRDYGLDAAPFIDKNEDGGARFSAIGLMLLKVCAKSHDIGKPFFSQIYALERGLSHAEFDLQKLHANLSRIIVKSWEKVIPGGVRTPNLLFFIADMGAAHQEKYDGTGYPDGTKGIQIGFIGRLMAITDAIAAMVNPRPYQKPMPLYICLNRLSGDTGTHFDPTLAGQVTKILKREGVSDDRYTGGRRDFGQFSEDFSSIIKGIDFDTIDLKESDQQNLATIKEVLTAATR